LHDYKERQMAKEQYLADLTQELYDAKKSGALFINVKESSEDLVRIYFKNGEIYYVSYGSAIGQDAIDIIEYYTLGNATYFDGIAAPTGTVPSKFSTVKFIAAMKKAYKTVRVP
jgi:intein-encoded DNA endonuclease-like protein